MKYLKIYGKWVSSMGALWSNTDKKTIGPEKCLSFAQVFFWTYCFLVRLFHLPASKNTLGLLCTLLLTAQGEAHRITHLTQERPNSGACFCNSSDL